MNSIITGENIFSRLFSDFRYELLKIIALIILLTAAIVFGNTESEKYYPHSRNTSSILKN